MKMTTMSRAIIASGGTARLSSPSASIVPVPSRVKTAPGARAG